MVVAFSTGRRDLDDRAIQALLGQGIELVAAPIGHFDPASDAIRGHVACTAVGQVDVTVEDQTLYSGTAPQPSAMPPAWVELAEAVHGAILYIAFTDTTPAIEDQLDQVARDGHLLGASVTLHISPAWAAAQRVAIPKVAK